MFLSFLPGIKESVCWTPPVDVNTMKTCEYHALCGRFKDLLLLPGKLEASAAHLTASLGSGQLWMDLIPGDRAPLCFQWVVCGEWKVLVGRQASRRHRSLCMQCRKLQGRCRTHLCHLLLQEVGTAVDRVALRGG